MMRWGPATYPLNWCGPAVQPHVQKSLLKQLLWWQYHKYTLQRLYVKETHTIKSPSGEKRSVWCICVNAELGLLRHPQLLPPNQAFQPLHFCSAQGFSLGCETSCSVLLGNVWVETSWLSMPPRSPPWKCGIFSFATSKNRTKYCLGCVNVKSAFPSVIRGRTWQTCLLGEQTPISCSVQQCGSLQPLSLSFFFFSLSGNRPLDWAPQILDLSHVVLGMCLGFTHPPFLFGQEQGCSHVGSPFLSWTCHLSPQDPDCHAASASHAHP